MEVRHYRLDRITLPGKCFYKPYLGGLRLPVALILNDKLCLPETAV